MQDYQHTDRDRAGAHGVRADQRLVQAAQPQEVSEVEEGATSPQARSHSVSDASEEVTALALALNDLRQAVLDLQADAMERDKTLMEWHEKWAGLNARLGVVETVQTKYVRTTDDE